MTETAPYKPKNKLRIVTAASLFDGHDAAINIMRRIIQASGAEVIHLGHDRSVKEIVDCAIQEDAQAIAITSYQGGHMEFFKYMHDLLKKAGCGHIKIFGGGGGTILPAEIKELHKYGITRIYSPDDGRSMGLQGMINDLVKRTETTTPSLKGEKFISNGWKEHLKEKDWKTIAQLISFAENLEKEFKKIYPEILKSFQANGKPAKKFHNAKYPPSGGKGGCPVLGITGTGGAGKSSLVDELVRRFLIDFENKSVAIISVDPSKKKTGGALLGDRIRMNSISNDRVYMRSLATRQSNLALSKYVQEAINVVKAAGYDLIILETSGIGQSDTEITEHSDLSLYVMTPEYGAATQLEKIDMLDFADIIALNKFDKRGAQDALRDVRKQFKRNHKKFNVPDEKLPVFGTIASQFNDPGMNSLYIAVMNKISEKTKVEFETRIGHTDEMSEKIYIIPPARIRYLSEISENNRSYDEWVDNQSEIANKLFSLYNTILLLGGPDLIKEDGVGSPPFKGGVPEGGGGSLPSQGEVSPSGGGGGFNSPPSQGGVPEGGGGSLPSQGEVFPSGEGGGSYTGKYSKGLMNHPNLKTFRKELRNSLTPAEAKLWTILQGRKLGGRKFRRQHSIGPYVVDFFCPEEQLAIEIDGNNHYKANVAYYDNERTIFLTTYGIKVLRFENKMVFEQTDFVVEGIREGFGWKNETTPYPSLGRRGVKGTIPTPPLKGGELVNALSEKFYSLKKELDPRNWEIIQNWESKSKQYKDEFYIFKVRNKEIKIKTHTESLSHTQIPKVAVPRYEAWGEILRWVLEENFPGEFPYTAGVYPFKRTEEDPARMFAGEGGPERTNKRFHYVSKGLPAKRLSTAFDSVTLYGRDPHHRPDIYGKVGNSGVSICCLDDAKKLYSGFNLADPKTSVSMTINGPAPTLTAFFMNAAIDQQCEIYIKQNDLEKQVEKKINDIFKKRGVKRPAYQGKLPDGNEGLGLMLLGVTGDQVLDKNVYEKIKVETLKQVRGTVQADILKEDQAQNTCIFSTEFSLRVMGDVQQYFIENAVRNFYSVSISGYHIAEAGANPITQLAFTLANGFTYVEYYLSRGMHIDDFAPNLSFFFSNGIDPEYAVIGRVARRIWAKAMKNKYKGNERSQMLKYHIQTSGRSLHAQEIDFNDIRTTLQALYAIYDNCNSLHTNAYDEAITTPTEESVRRAMAIQLIINKELGLSKNENPLQGSFIIEELTDIVEEAVLTEFDKITERGGVLGAMETMYQRGKIQEESLYYETLKHTGEFPIIGVNTYLSSKGSPTILPKEVIRATNEEKEYQIKMLEQLHKGNHKEADKILRELQLTAIHNENIFAKLMQAVKYCSLGQITEALFEVGGQYRRNM